MAGILIIEDEHALGGALSLAVHRMGHIPMLVASGAAGLKALTEGRYDAVILDIGLPDMSGLKVLETMRAAGVKVPVVIITAHGTLDHAIAAQKLGVADYLVKPIDLGCFEEVVGSLVASHVVVAKVARDAAPTLIGAGPGMHRVYLGIARACSGEMPVMIYGPSGSGKTLAAQLIHANGQRSGDGLRRVQCGVIKHLAALQAQLGDEVGTLILEDLDGLSGELQHELAEMIGERQGRMPRLIATMMGAPSDGERGGVLRSELFYAFSVLAIEMPALKDRAGDIPELCRFFHGMRGDVKGASFEMSSAALSALQAYSWPGNIRELQNVLEHAWAMSRGETVYPGHLPPHVAQVLQDASGMVVSAELEGVIGRWLESQMEITPEGSWSYENLLEGVEGSMLRYLLERFEGRPTRLAAALGMNRATLRQKLRRYGLREDA